MSSTHPVKRGNRSETSIPLSPYFLNRNLELSSRGSLRMRWYPGTISLIHKRRHARANDRLKRPVAPVISRVMTLYRFLFRGDVVAWFICPYRACKKQQHGTKSESSVHPISTGRECWHFHLFAYPTTPDTTSLEHRFTPSRCHRNRLAAAIWAHGFSAR